MSAPATIALAAGVAAAGLVGWGAWYAVVRGLRAKRALDAARALTDAHLAELEHRTELAMDRSAPLADRSEQLFDAADELRTSVAGLRTILAAPSHEKRRMWRRVADVLLPTPEEDEDAS